MLSYLCVGDMGMGIGHLYSKNSFWKILIANPIITDNCHSNILKIFLV